MPQSAPTAEHSSGIGLACTDCAQMVDRQHSRPTGRDAKSTRGGRQGNGEAPGAARAVVAPDLSRMKSRRAKFFRFGLFWRSPQICGSSRQPRQQCIDDSTETKKHGGGPMAAPVISNDERSGRLFGRGGHARRGFRSKAACRTLNLGSER